MVPSAVAFLVLPAEMGPEILPHLSKEGSPSPSSSDFREPPWEAVSCRTRCLGAFLCAGVVTCCWDTAQPSCCVKLAQRAASAEASHGYCCHCRESPCLPPRGSFIPSLRPGLMGEPEKREGLCGGQPSAGLSPNSPPFVGSRLGGDLSPTGKMFA